MKSWSVYKHVSPSGKVYIGISSDVKRRWAADGYYYHLSDTAFSRALKKYGWNNFEHHILHEGFTKEQACAKEKELIAQYKAQGISYNLTDGGDGTYGFKPSREQIQKRIDSRVTNSDIEYLVIDKSFNYVICATQPEAADYLGVTQRVIGHVLSQPIGYTCKKHYLWKHKKSTPVDIDTIKMQIDEALKLRKQRMSEHAKAISHKMVAASKKERANLTEEERKKRFGHSESHIGKRHSEETRKKLSEKAKGRNVSKMLAARKLYPFNPTNVRPVVQYMISGELVKEYPSITQASIETGIIQSGINNCLNGRSSSSGGYKWLYKN